jgi:pimeloyl-ACP methyl ester carboxylesterase
VYASLAVAIAATASPVEYLPTAHWQVAPAQRAKFDGEPVTMKVTKTRAVLLVHGMQLHILRPEKAAGPELHEWVRPKSDMVAALGEDFDVYAFSYAQTLPVDAVASSAGLRTAIAKMKKANYEEIILIGHSAGGVISRQFVERHPDAGVTKVIAVCSPFAGSELANITFGLPKNQSAFSRSLAPRIRLEAPAPMLPPRLDFACVVCKIPRVSTDSLVNLDSQWPEDLRVQGVPAVLVSVNHFDAMKSPQSIAAVSELAREKLVRWSPELVEKGAAVLFGKDADAAAVRRSSIRKRN